MQYLDLKLKEINIAAYIHLCGRPLNPFKYLVMKVLHMLNYLACYKRTIYEVFTSVNKNKFIMFKHFGALS